MLQNSLGLVLLNSFGHHIQNIVHDSRSELEVEMRLDPLLRNSLGDTIIDFRVSAAEKEMR